MSTMQDEIPLEELLTVRLTGDVQYPSEQLAWVREQERLRLCRELHDGLGPTLAAVHLQAGTLRSLISCNPVAADALVGELRSALRTMMADLRCLVYALRPPTLDELGLVGAIRQHTALYRAHCELKTLQVEVEAPDYLPLLPAAVEVAVYRIVQEALANVVRHAQARTCCIRLWVDDALYLEIIDDGVGLPEKYRTGVGLLSMRERAAELGGRCVIEPAFLGGTRVYAQI